MSDINYAIVNTSTGVVATAFHSHSTARTYLDWYLDKEQHAILPHGIIKDDAIEAWAKSTLAA